MAMGRLIGRDADVASVVGLLEAGARVVTLWGAAGVGKTRLARACAERAVAGAGFAASWFCDLSAATTPDGVCSVLSDALGARMEAAPEQAVAQLGRALAARGRALVVLDNFEQVVAAAPALLGTWIAAAGDASFLVTSREALGLGDEILHEVAPLDAAAAAELFRERAGAAGRAPAGDDARLVGEIVRRLDCLPLAVELAAAQTALLGLPDLLDRLPRLDLLDGGRRDVSERQRTLRGALDWSWRLLDTGEQAALAQCGVFRGGFTLAAAEAVIAGTPVLAALRSLRRRSLLQVSPAGDGEVRYHLLAEVREYAGERLGASGDESAVRARHATYYMDAGARWGGAAQGPDGAAALRRLGTEQENLLAAHQFAVAAAPAQALRIGLALQPLLLARGPLELLRRVLGEALAAARGATDVEDPLLSRALCGRAMAARRLGRSDEAMADFDAALAAARRAGGRALEAAALCERGRWLAEQSHCDRAEAQLGEALALARAAGDRAIEAEVLTNLGLTMWFDGQLGRAQGYYEQASPLARAAGNRALEGRILANLGALAYERGDLEPFFTCTRAALAIVDAAGDSRYAATLRMNLANGTGEELRFDEAAALFEQAMLGLREAGDLVAEGVCEANLGWNDQRRHGAGAGQAHFERALRLLSGAQIGWADGLLQASLAAALASAGRLAEARAMQSAAVAAMASVTDGRLRDAAELLCAHVDVATGRRDVAAERLAREPTDPDNDRSMNRLARELLRRALETPLPALPPPRGGDAAPFPNDALLVATDAMGFRAPGGEWVDLRRRRPLRLVLAALLTAAPAKPLTTEALLAAGWPGEQVLRSAGASRVHVAIATLRRLGMGAVLRHDASGYFLDPTVRVITDVRTETKVVSGT